MTRSLANSIDGAVQLEKILSTTRRLTMETFGLVDINVLAVRKSAHTKAAMMSHCAEQRFSFAARTTNMQTVYQWAIGAQVSK